MKPSGRGVVSIENMKNDGFVPARRTGHSFNSVISFLQEEWRSHESARNLWTRERKTLLKRASALELEAEAERKLNAMLERRLAMLEEALRQERARNKVGCVDNVARDMFEEERSLAMEIAQAQHYIRNQASMISCTSDSEGDDDGDQDYSFPFTNPESAAARERDDENTKRLMDNLNGTNRDLRRTTRNGIALKGWANPAVASERLARGAATSGASASLSQTMMHHAAMRRDLLADMEKSKQGQGPMVRRAQEQDAAQLEKALDPLLVGDVAVGSTIEAARESKSIDPVDAFHRSFAQRMAPTSPPTSATWPHRRSASMQELPSKLEESADADGKATSKSQDDSAAEDVMSSQYTIAASARHSSSDPLPQDNRSFQELCQTSPNADSKTQSEDPESPVVAHQKTLDSQRSVDNGNSPTSDSNQQIRCLGLLSHLDGVRALAFDGNNNQPARLLSVSEDSTVKLWALPDVHLDERDAATRDVEPLATYRGHIGGVFSAALSVERNVAFSGGADASIRAWQLPKPGSGLYSQHGSAAPYAKDVFVGHTDMVWSLCLHLFRSQLLLSASADGTVRLWDTSMQSPLRLTMSAPTLPPAPRPSPTCVASCPLDELSCLAGFDNGSMLRYDIESGEAFWVAKGNASGNHVSQVNGIALHNTLPVVLAAGEDGLVHTYDLSGATNRPLATLSAVDNNLRGTNGASAVALDPNSMQLATASHSGALRLWDLRATSIPSCSLQLDVHVPKGDEGTHTLAYAPNGTGSSGRPLLASGGADGAVRLITQLT
mmetsp:Transcript_4558/g.8565  ORF Transcript_4558/g.8565 Transcript_4558/m.8565 type:complete len:781 (+) Transcript_4558:232-2574(+)|eukprot:CAMPEP_0114279606 /NCGR_PEP_ID=MMETSP0059-20121206/1980_1 /TAXON_ID=36894 /ORGANISM="Pyramimonas parkeae, Strain CCMP726" /LENGTH=780 /DNA_ID=CAMNT_0001399923 /DNA_START=184 /DNA_END=2526 /DNA_ORIENTATION=+